MNIAIHLWSSLPGLTRQSIGLRKKMDARVSAFTRVFDALLPAHDALTLG